jgi:asparagine synthase (glutamine-hydrolysing)
MPDGAAERMLAALRHRGPDEERIVPLPGGLLMCTRLSVMDLSAQALQPFYDERGTAAAVCNGEIYNAPALAEALAGRGHRLRTSCDSEVVPHLYEQSGPGFAEHLEGMFAVAVLDLAARRLLLARDRWGIKPLYYARARSHAGEYLVFASELNCLLAGGLAPRPDRQSIHDYAALGYIPGPATFYEHIHAVEPGELIDVTLADGRISVRRRRYHRWTIAPDRSIGLDTAAATTERLLESSVAAQSRADRPVGLLLSGGLDSSLIAAMRARRPGDVQAFGMRFDDERYDESWAGRLVAKHVGVAYTTVEPPYRQGTFEHIRAVLRRVGQPYSDTSLFAAYALAERVRQSVVVCLGGEGGDEAFGGYERFRDLAGDSGLEAPGDRVGTIESKHRLLDRAEHQQLCLDRDLLPVRRHFEPRWDYVWRDKPTGADRLVALATEASTRLTLADDYLVKADISSMAQGLELRVPMLDERLFAYALTLPTALKATPAHFKVVPRALAARLLPERVACKPKWGFSIPPYGWLADGVRHEIAAAVSDPGSRLTEYFTPKVYRAWAAAFRSARTPPGLHELDLFDRILMLLSLDLHLADLTPPSGGSGVALPI